MRNRYFIWKRHTPRQKPRHAASFWADTLLLIAMGVAWFFVRPWKAQPLGHAAGTVGNCVGACAVRRISTSRRRGASTYWPAGPSRS